tara:strand:+ start:123 stop:395 length:273 start_codon:yes stop_codon:yes gene_type:complete
MGTIAIKGLGKAYQAAKNLFKSRGIKPSPDVINSVKPGTNLKKKRDIQDSVVKTKDKVMESLDAEGKRSVRTSVPLNNTNKEIAKIYDKK